VAYRACTGQRFSVSCGSRSRSPQAECHSTKAATQRNTGEKYPYREYRAIAWCGVNLRKQIIRIISADVVIGINRLVGAEAGTHYHCVGIDRVESALHATYYPGDFPNVHRNVAGIAGALCFYLVRAHAFSNGNKRTALISCATFLGLNGYVIRRRSIDGRQNSLAKMIAKCAMREVGKDDLFKWFTTHIERTVRKKG